VQLGLLHQAAREGIADLAVAARFGGHQPQGIDDALHAGHAPGEHQGDPLGGDAVDLALQPHSVAVAHHLDRKAVQVDPGVDLERRFHLFADIALLCRHAVPCCETPF
jgi:hypothetical protein